MSGANCPDCGSFDVSAIDQSTDTCSFCGWEGPTRPRRQLTSTTRKRMVGENQRNRELKESGQLFFLRVHTKSPESVQEMRTKVGDIFGTYEELKHNNRQSYVFLRLNRKPSEDEVTALNSLPDMNQYSVT